MVMDWYYYNIYGNNTIIDELFSVFQDGVQDGRRHNSRI